MSNKILKSNKLSLVYKLITANDYFRCVNEFWSYSDYHLLGASCGLCSLVELWYFLLNNK